MAEKRYVKTWKDDFYSKVVDRLPREMDKRRREQELYNLKSQLDKLPYQYCQMMMEGVMGHTQGMNVGDYLADSPKNEMIRKGIMDYLATGVPTYLITPMLTLNLEKPQVRDPQAAREYYDNDAAQRREEWKDSVYAALIEDLVILDELGEQQIEARPAEQLEARPVEQVLGKSWKEELVEWISTYALEDGETIDRSHIDRVKVLVDSLPDKHCMFLREALMHGDADTEIDMSEYYADSDDVFTVEDDINEFLSYGDPYSLREALFYMNKGSFPDPIDPEAANEYFRAIEEARVVQREADAVPEAEAADEFDGFEVLDELEKGEEENTKKRLFLQRMRADKDSFRQMINECRERDPEAMKPVEEEMNTWYAENVKLEQSAIGIIDAEFNLTKLQSRRNSLGANASPAAMAKLEKSIENTRKQIKELYKKNDKLIEKTISDLDKRAKKSEIDPAAFEFRRRQLQRGNLSLTPELYKELLAERAEAEARQGERRSETPTRTQIQLDLGSTTTTRPIAQKPQEEQKVAQHKPIQKIDDPELSEPN